MLHNQLSNMYTLLPAKVLSYNAETMRADVLPLIKVKDINGIDQNSAPTTDLPVIFPDSGDVYIRTPLLPGTLVMVGYSSVALDDILESTDPVLPTSRRRFSQKDGVVLGSYRFDGGKNTLTGADQDLVIHRRSTDTVIKLTASGDVIITGAKNVITECETLNVNASNNATISSPKVTVDAAETSFSGNVKISGTLTGGKILTSNGKDLDKHTHKYNPGPGSPTSTSAPE